MQMPNTTPQGIAGLMQKPPGQVPGQQPPMPSPNKASPMAGLGSVDDRVSAYQGNTKPLEQRYAMSQDLLDLLALQKIKSQKDAAARQMQLQMAQQGAQDGQANMTIAQQREQEVNQLTKNELAQQRGDTAQKQAGDQQAMMQKMMGGIAGAPGANTAAQPRAMAAGGIVGYADGGAVGYAGGGEILDQARERRKAAQQKVYSYGLRQRQQDPEGFQTAQAELQAAQAALQAAEKSYAAEMSAAGVDKPISAASPMGAVGRYEKTQAPAPAPVSEAQASDDIDDFATGGPDDVFAPTAPKPPPAAPADLAAKPLLPGAAAPPQVQPGVVAPANDFGTKLQAAALKNAEIDSAARQISEEKRIEGRTALTPDQRKVHDEGIAGLQKMYREQYDPERQRREGIKQFLLGAGGRRYGEFGGGARAAMAYDEKQRANKLKEFGDVQKSRTGLIDIDRANVKGGIDAGMKTYEQSSMSQRQGLESGRGLYGTDVGSQDKKLDRADRVLDRDIEKLKITAQADATAATREGTTFNQQQTLLNSTIRNRAQVVENIKKRFASDFDMLERGLNSKPNDKELLKKRTDLNIKITAELDKETQLFDDSIARIETAMMGKNSASIGTTKKIK